MTSLNTQLWELISDHKMPSDASERPFINQLMAEHGISRETATVAIEEYRKFIYLCATRSDRNVPSKAVDLVWHLHMQHSRDYWDVFCKKIGKPIHHNPGGKNTAHISDYKATYAAYKTLFGTPPKGIWKHNSTFDKLVGLFISGVLICVGLGMITTGEPPLIGAIFFLGIGITMFISAATGLTEKGEFTLIFESGDPFADNDVGDCGSDGGGCGD